MNVSVECHLIIDLTSEPWNPECATCSRFSNIVFVFLKKWLVCVATYAILQVCLPTQLHLPQIEQLDVAIIVARTDTALFIIVRIAW